MTEVGIFTQTQAMTCQTTGRCPHFFSMRTNYKMSELKWSTGYKSAKQYIYW